MKLLESLFQVPMEWRCAVAEWMYGEGTLSLAKFLKVNPCGRGITNNPTCKLCPYAEGSLTEGLK